VTTSGSNIARSGFKNEDDVVYHFNNWKISNLAQKWLSDLNVRPEILECVFAERIHGEKTDVKLSLKISGFNKPYNLQVKLVSIDKGFNQVDKRWVDDYHELWEFPKEVFIALKKFTGEIKPLGNCRDKKKRRLFFDELENHEQSQLVSFFSNKKIKIVQDVVQGRGPLAANYVLVVDKSTQTVSSKVIPINQAIKIMSSGPVEISPRGSLRIGKILMQRKGGDSGRPTANMLQFKEDPKEFLV
jgi:hypothetical protein